MANGKPGRPAKYSKEFKDNAVDYAISSGKTYAQAAADLGVRLPVERKGSRHDNAVAESFFGTFKNE